MKSISRSPFNWIVVFVVIMMFMINVIGKINSGTSIWKMVIAVMIVIIIMNIIFIAPDKKKQKKNKR